VRSGKGVDIPSLSPAATVFGQTVVFTTLVTPNPAPATISFVDGGVLVGVGTVSSVSNGIAQVTTITLPASAHLIRAVSSGGAEATSRANPMCCYVVTAIPSAGFQGFRSVVNYAAGITPHSGAMGTSMGTDARTWWWPMPAVGT